MGDSNPDTSHSSSEIVPLIPVSTSSASSENSQLNITSTLSQNGNEADNSSASAGGKKKRGPQEASPTRSAPPPIPLGAASASIPIKSNKDNNKKQQQTGHGRAASQASSMDVGTASPKDTLSVSGSIGGRTISSNQGKGDAKKQTKPNQPQSSSSGAAPTGLSGGSSGHGHQGRGPKVDTKQVGLFSHLPEKKLFQDLSNKVGFSSADTGKIHPAILSLGLKYNEGTITGATARTIAMLEAFLEFLRDYKASEKKAFSRDFDKELKPQIQFLVDSRPLCIAMGNASKFLFLLL